MDFDLVETGRSDLLCGCGCGRRWLVSRGQLRHKGATAGFVAMPTLHEDRVWWLAIEDVDGIWVSLRTWRAGESLTAVVVDGDRTPLSEVAPFAAGALVSSRQAVLDDPARKARVFAAHDAILRAHHDARHVFDPEHGRDYTFKMPDCVFAQPADQRSPRNQSNFAEHGDDTFVRALLPIPISDGSELRLGVWVQVAREDFLALVRVFWDDEAAYAALRLRGRIENKLPITGHDVRGLEVSLAARDPSQCLFVTGADAAWLATLVRDGISVAGLRGLQDDIRRALSNAN